MEITWRSVSKAQQSLLSSEELEFEPGDYESGIRAVNEEGILKWIAKFSWKKIMNIGKNGQ